jgi:hypothetical protein
MRALKTCLWIVGLICLLAALGLFLPMSVLESLANAFGNEAFPDSPAFAYTIRGLCATYVAAGVFLIILARSPMKYGVMVPFAGAAAIFVGVACGVAGVATRVPPMWFLGDLVSSTLAGILILLLWRRAVVAERRHVGPGPQEAQ